MVKLVLVSTSSPDTNYSFDKEIFYIGGQHSPSADVKLFEDLKDEHIQVSRDQNESHVSYTLTNLAHDPFITINNLPFGKKELKDKDLIQIYDTTLEVQLIEVATPQADNLLKPPTPKPSNPSPFAFSRPNFDVDELKPSSASLQQPPLISLPTPLPKTTAEAAKPKKVPTVPPKIETPKFAITAGAKGLEAPLKIAKLSLKDYYLSEYDDEEDVLTESKRKPTTQKNQEKASGHTPFNPAETRNKKKRLRIVGAGFAGILLLFFLSVYWIHTRAAEEEIHAARSLADISMALTYADVKNIQPKNQNWADIEFINNILSTILASEYDSQANFDPHGKLLSSSYLLRIYTNNNLSQFVVIAQPSPNLTQWVSPRSPIVIDSKAMEIRKIKDLKALNRLLVNPNLSEGAHAEEISDLIQQGELIPLSKLKEKRKNYGFVTPTLLSVVRPSAENLIYNAARYYPFGQSMMMKALDVFESTMSSQEIAHFQHELGNLAEFSNIVLYTDKGLSTALNAQKALYLLSPKERFLVASLQFNASNMIIGAHIIPDDTFNADLDREAFITPVAPTMQDDSSVAMAQKLETEPSPAPPNYSQQHIDHMDPLFIKLSELSQNRQIALKPTYEDIIALVESQYNRWKPGFQDSLDKLREEFVSVDKEQYRKMNTELHQIATDVAYIPASCFIEFIKAANLETVFHHYLDNLKRQSQINFATEQEIEGYVKRIELSKNWTDLENTVTQSFSRLNFNHVPDTERLISYQNTIRTHVIKKLNSFLLATDQESLPQEAFLPEFRLQLITILEDAWIIDPETLHFYLDEFDIRSAPMRVIKFNDNERTTNGSL